MFSRLLSILVVISPFSFLWAQPSETRFNDGSVLYSSNLSDKSCDLTIYLHGHLFSPFKEDVIKRFDFKRAISQLNNVALFVPHLMTQCRRFPCRAYDKKFSYEQAVDKVFVHLNSQKRKCGLGFKTQMIVGHSGAYKPVAQMLESHQLIESNCTRSDDTWSGQVSHIVLVDALYGHLGAFQKLRNTLGRCANSNLKFAHLSDRANSSPRRNSCRLMGKKTNCIFSSELNFDWDFAMYMSSSHRGHWQVVSDSIQTWVGLAQSSAGSH